MPNVRVNVSSCASSCHAAATSSAFGYSVSPRARLYAEYQWPRPRMATRHFLCVTPAVYRIARSRWPVVGQNERMSASAASTLLLITFTGVALVVLLITWARLPAFIALLIGSLFVGVAARMPPADIPRAFQQGVGDTLGFTAMVIG